MHLRPALLAAMFALIAACSQFPELEDTVSDSDASAAYMELVPVETLQARAGGQIIDDTAQSGLEARVTRLKARAQGLRRTVIDGGTRRRMADGVTG